MKLSEKGVTPIELLVTCSIVGIIIFIIYMVFYSTTQAIEKNKNRIEIHQEARVILNRIQKEISSAYFSDRNISIRLKGEDSDYGEFSNDRIDFVCTLNPFKLDAKQSDLMEVGYYLKYGENIEIGTLIRRYSGMVDSDSDKGGYEQILGRNIRSLDFKYFDGSDWSRDWDTNKKGRLPHLVEITIIIFDVQAKRDYSFSTIVSLPQAEIYKG